MNTIANGVWPTMITPYTEDNKIDYDAVLKIIEWYDQQGVTGIFAVCQSSEMFFLNKEERLELARFVVEHTPKHIGVIASGHVAEKVEDQIEEAKAIIDAGVESYVFISNQFAKPEEDDDVVRKNIEYIIDKIPGESFGIYECPYPYKRLLTPENLKWCADTGRFSFLKDTCCNVDQLKAKLEAVKGTNLKIFNANSATLLESLRMGCAGFSGVMANFHSEMYAWLCKNFDKDQEKAELMQAFIGAASVIECQCYPVNAKYHMNLEGVTMTLNCRNKDKEELTASRKLEVEQLQKLYHHIRKEFI
ncbi:MAG: dihydrodipicolinate synthase family protein [Lachnospiraceae bacterium]|nr:dihydrodipicolinate synthase family protein [Lachnospiraceae bacterium]